MAQIGEIKREVSRYKSELHTCKRKLAQAFPEEARRSSRYACFKVNVLNLNVNHIFN